MVTCFEAAAFLLASSIISLYCLLSSLVVGGLWEKQNISSWNNHLCADLTFHCEEALIWSLFFAVKSKDCIKQRGEDDYLVLISTLQQKTFEHIPKSYMGRSNMKEG